MSVAIRVGGRRDRAIRVAVLSVVVVVIAALAASCSLLPGDPDQPGQPGPPPTDFAPLSPDAADGLDTGANDFVTGLAAAGDTVVAAGIVYGNRLAPSFRYSTDAGATWHLGRLSAPAEQATPPDQGDQTSDVAVSIVDGVTRWVVLGTSWHQPLIWTSTDAMTWDRHLPSNEQIATEAHVNAIAAVPDGFVMVGTDAVGEPTAWTSADGVTWRPRPMGGSGTPVSVTSKGSTVVAVGSREDAYATWSSNDRGQTWKRAVAPPTPEDDDDFGRRLVDVTASGDGFTAIGSYFAREWRPVVYRSSNGSSWHQAAAPPASKGGADGSRIRAAAGEVAVTQEYGPQNRPRLWARQGESWREARTPLNDRSRLREGEWTLDTLISSGDAWVVSAQLSRNGQVVSELWRSIDGGRTFDVVPRPDAELNQPVAAPQTVVRAGDQTLVFGDSRRRPVVWSRSGTESFGRAALISEQATDRVWGAVSGPRGVLAYGTRAADGTESAVVWRRAGVRWHATEPGVFSRAGRLYASSSIGQIAWLRDRWVAVGETSDNGDINSSALVATSTDGKTWVRGRAAHTFTRAGGRVWYDVTDLQGDHDRTRDMNGVAMVGDRHIAVGDSTEGDGKGKGRVATIWTSDDARRWTMRRLPFAGLTGSSMDRVAVRGSTVVAVGTGSTSKGTPARLVSWRSADGGRTWTQQLLDPALETRDGVTSLVALQSGFALIGERVEGTSRPVVLVSDDGVAWRDLPLAAGGPGPSEGAVASSAVGDGDDLWLLLWTTNHAGAGSRLVVQPTR